jgi:hypothetical protein
VLAGSILIFDGKFLRAGGPIPEPLLFADADNHGSRPLIGAAKRLRMIEQGPQVFPDRMATVNALNAKIHELAVANKLSDSEEAECNLKMSQQIGANRDMLGSVERLDFTDVERLFPAVCGPSAGQK